MEVKVDRGLSVVIAEDQTVTATLAAVTASAIAVRDVGSAAGMDVTGAAASMGKPFPVAPAETRTAEAVTGLAATAAGAIAEMWIVTGAAVRRWIAVMPAAASVSIAVRAPNAVTVVKLWSAVIVSIAAIFRQFQNKQMNSINKGR